MDYVSDEAERAGLGAAAYVKGCVAGSKAVATKPGFGVRYVLPQQVHTDAAEDVSLFLRVTQPFGKVKFTVRDGEKELTTVKRLKAAPGEMEKITLKQSQLAAITGPVEVSLEVVE